MYLTIQKLLQLEIVKSSVTFKIIVHFSSKDIHELYGERTGVYLVDVNDFSRASYPQ